MRAHSCWASRLPLAPGSETNLTLRLPVCGSRTDSTAYQLPLPRSRTCPLILVSSVASQDLNHGAHQQTHSGDAVLRDVPSPPRRTEIRPRISLASLLLSAAFELAKSAPPLDSAHTPPVNRERCAARGATLPHALPLRFVALARAAV